MVGIRLCPSGGEGPPYNALEGGFQLRSDGNGLDSCFTVRDNNAGALVSGNAGNTLDDMATTNFPSNDGNWHFYVGTFDAGTGIRDLYVDGSLAAQETGNVAMVMAATEHLCIGAKDSPPGNDFRLFSSFQIFDVRIYNYALIFQPTPVFYGAPVVKGTQMTLTWSEGRLLQAPGVTGPWTPTGATSPYTVNITSAPRMFYKVSNP